MLATGLMSETTVEHFERMIYLPMLLTILDTDAKILIKAPVKFKSPYLAVIKRAMDNVQKDLSETQLYFRNNKMKLIKEGNDGLFTSFLMVDGSNHYKRNYMNYRLRNRSEELLGIYLKGGTVVNATRS